MISTSGKTGADIIFLVSTFFYLGNSDNGK